MVEIFDVAKEAVEVYGAKNQLLFALSKIADVNVGLFNLFMDKADLEEFTNAYADMMFAMMQVELILDSSTNGVFIHDMQMVMQHRAEREHHRLTTIKSNIRATQAEARAAGVSKGDVVPEISEVPKDD